MFKHITRLTARSHNLKTSSLTALKLPSYTLVNKTSLRSFASFSQVSQDFSNLHKTQKKPTQEGKYLHQVQSSLATIDPRKTAINASMPDYEVHEMDVTRIKTVEVTHNEVLNKHPFEIAMAEQREKLEYRNLNKNDLLLFNMPSSLNEAAIRELCSVKGVQIIDLSIVRGIDESSIAYAKVTVGHPRQVKQIKDALYNKWIEDKKLKVKTKEDLAYETFNNRTLVVRNIPINYKDKQLIELFENFGTIVGLELPLRDISIDQHIKNKTDPFREQQKEEHERELRRAEQIVKESIQANEEYEQFLTNYLGEERAQLLLASYQHVGEKFQTDEQVALLDQSRKLSINNILTQLQSESTEVKNAKQLLEKLKHQLEAAEVPSLGSTGSDFLSTAVEDEKTTIRNAVQYLNKNREEIDEGTLGTLNTLIYQNLEQQADPLQRLQELSKSELATAYDSLIESLKQREQLIEKRIKDQINHLGKEERILFEEKDWKRELEDIKDPMDPFKDVYKAEEYLSLSEQVRNVILQKNLPPEMKLYQIVTRLFNPFEKANFNETQLAFTENTELNDLRSFPRPDPTQPPSIARMLFEGAPLEPEIQQQVDARIEELRDKLDLPFDELYHKEKKLIEQVIKAEQALKNKEKVLPDPMGEHRKFDPRELPTGTLEGTGIEAEHQFTRDQRRQCNSTSILTLLEEKLFSEQIDTNQGSGKFEYLVQNSSEYQRLIDQGVISQQEYDKFLKMKSEANKVNLGYAFVTFSLSDQTKLALIMTANAMADGVQIESFLKGNIDHRDMDSRYYLNKLKNDSKVVDEIEKLRTAKQELRDFERNLDQDLPSLKKLNQFRKLARDHIENKPYEARVGYERTKEEEEKVNEMIRKLQKENPDIDYTQLFDTERAEQARRAQHKKALASYKAYQFLKHGVEFQAKTQKQKTEQPKNKLQSKDPYEFPPLDQTVAKFLTKDKFPRVIKGRDSIDRPGRRFGYEEQDFLEVYFGKDYAKLSSSNVELDNPVFGYNESLKRKYPIDKYLQLPVLDAQRRRVQEAMGDSQYDITKEDEEFQQFMENFDVEKDNENKYQDFPHPQHPGRTLLGDMEIRLKNYIARKQKQYPDMNLWNPGEVQGIWQALYEEYFPGQQPPRRIPFKKRDQRRSQKFEPHYEGEASSSDAPAQEQSTSKDDQQHSSRQDQQVKHQGAPRQTSQEDQYEEMQFESGRELDPDLSQLNRDFIYDYKHRMKTEDDFNPRKNAPIRLQRFEQAAEDMDMPAEELYESMKNLGNFSERSKYGGVFTDKQKFGMLDESKVKTREKAIRNLNDYARDSESEREDEDIYQHYINQMNRAKKEKALEQEKMSREEKLLAEQMENLEKMLPETPRFEGYFKSQSQGKHPFEEDEFKYDQDLEEEEEQQRRADEEYDEELYQRELKGRLMGHKLTPRQFEVLFKSRLDENAKLSFERDEKRKQYITSRDIASLLMEQMEVLRRRKVLDGEWTEEESHQKLKELAKEAQDSVPTSQEDAIRNRELHQNLAQYVCMQHPSQLFDREYYFDEGLGETVQEHAENIKAAYPDIQVQYRRDRDGYAIIRTLYKPKFKYDIDEIANYDPSTTESKIKESLNEVLKNILPVDKESITDFSKLDKKTLENSIKMFTPYSGNEEEDYDLDAKSKDALDRLIQERFTGIYKDDKEGFAKAFLDFTQKATFDPTKKLTKSLRMNFSGALDSEVALEDLDKEKEQMTYELAQQISMRVKEHYFFKERKPTDFITGRRSEQALFSQQVDNYERSAQILQQQNEDLLRAGDNKEEGFDKEAYKQIKAEIKKRREAKERLLKQGFPELKPYITI